MCNAQHFAGFQNAADDHAQARKSPGRLSETHKANIPANCKHRNLIEGLPICMSCSPPIICSPVPRYCLHLLDVCSADLLIIRACVLGSTKAQGGAQPQRPRCSLSGATDLLSLSRVFWGAGEGKFAQSQTIAKAAARPQLPPGIPCPSTVGTPLQALCRYAIYWGCSGLAEAGWDWLVIWRGLVVLCVWICSRADVPRSHWWYCAESCSRCVVL